MHGDDYYVVKADADREVRVIPESDRRYTEREVIQFVRAFHLDTVQGRYSRELLDWCDKWVDENVRRPI